MKDEKSILATLISEFVVPSPCESRLYRAVHSDLVWDGDIWLWSGLVSRVGA